MLQVFFRKLLRLVALTLLITQVTFTSSALAQETQPTELINPQPTELVNPNDADVTVPDEPTAEDKGVPPNNQAEKPPVVSTPRLTFPQPPSPYDTEAIKRFNEELYGEGN
ncbi:MAG TPA: hypothetical protein V6C95_10600 [Coleofasciculaceae cyanobacterium]